MNFSSWNFFLNAIIIVPYFDFSLKKLALILWSKKKKAGPKSDIFSLDYLSTFKRAANSPIFKVVQLATLASQAFIRLYQQLTFCSVVIKKDDIINLLKTRFYRLTQILLSE
jgi:hypothetical protein